MGFIYMWTNTLNDKKYVGKSQKSTDSSYIGSGKYFRHAVEKYGIENFERTILEENVSNEILSQREKYWLDFYDVANDDGFYNISPNSDGGHHGADYRGDKNPMFGKKHPNHKPLFGSDNGMYGVSRYGSTNPNAKKVIIVDPDNNTYEGDCLKEVCVTIFGNADNYNKLKHMVNLYEKGSKPRKDSSFYGWYGKYKD